VVEPKPLRSDDRDSLGIYGGMMELNCAVVSFIETASVFLDAATSLCCCIIL
jgi:hypothetical protein